MPSPPFGILNLNKPAGITSRRAVDVVNRLVKPAKVGHAGTLDPLATGVLVVALGRATRLIEHIQSRPKSYRATFLLGRRSNTDDVEGEVTVIDESPHVTEAEIAALLPDFTGTIEQVPPAFSAVHVEGRRAYKLARQGEKVDLAPRPVEVHGIDLVEFNTPQLILDIRCGSGTYIRAIGRDLGERLGCGAVMSELARTAVGSYRIEESTPPDDVTRDTLPELLLPATTAVAHLPQHRCTADELEEIIHGRAMELSAGGYTDGATLALLTPEGELAALGSYSVRGGKVLPERVFCGPSGQAC